MRRPLAFSRCRRSLPALSLLAAACTSAAYAADADREVGAILAAANAEVLGDRSEWVVQPKPAEPPAPPDAGALPDVGPPPPAVLPVVQVESYDLARSLATAVAMNREYLTRKEQLYRQGLSVALVRFDFGPQLNSTLSYLWSDRREGTPQHAAGALVRASQILPTGGTLALTSGLNSVWPYGAGSADPFYSSSAIATLSQPLLRGAGYEVSHESLTQSERELVYAIRDFELYREGFAITVAGTWFALQSQRKTLANEDANYQSAVFDRGKAEALQRVGRNAEQEVFRARRREIEAKDQLITARSTYDRALDEFKILLGLPTTSLIDIAEAEPPYDPVRLDERSAVAAARHNRLDLITERQRVEDAERALRIAENGLLPGLDLVASHGLNGADSSFASAGPSDWTSSIGVVFTVPLRQKAQRNNYRSAMIALEQAKRALTLREDQLDLDIRDQLRRLRSTEERIELQKEQIVREQGAVTVTQIRYESGKLENRDLLEARQALVNAQNALIRLKTEHFVGRLRLLQNLGLFFIGPQGMWR